MVGTYVRTIGVVQYSHARYRAAYLHTETCRCSANDMERVRVGSCLFIVQHQSYTLHVHEPTTYINQIQNSYDHSEISCYQYFMLKVCRTSTTYQINHVQRQPCTTSTMYHINHVPNQPRTTSTMYHVNHVPHQPCTTSTTYHSTHART